MKLQKAKRRCLERGEIALIQGPDGEWLSNGRAAWECQCMGLTKENVRAVMDIKDKDVPDQFVRELDYRGEDRYTAFYDAKNDILLEDKGLVMVDGIDYLVLMPQEIEDTRPVYIRKDDLSPVWRTDMKPEYRLRRSEEDGTGRRVQLVAVCFDLLVCALIAPEGRRPNGYQDGEARYGADRIEQRITELWALMHGKTVEDMQFDQGWKYMLEHVEEAEGEEEDA